MNFAGVNDMGFEKGNKVGRQFQKGSSGGPGRPRKVVEPTGSDPYEDMMKAYQCPPSKEDSVAVKKAREYLAEDFKGFMQLLRGLRPKEAEQSPGQKLSDSDVGLRELIDRLIDEFEVQRCQQNSQGQCTGSAT